jgi:hypothetical protein
MTTLEWDGFSAYTEDGGEAAIQAGYFLWGRNTAHDANPQYSREFAMNRLWIMQAVLLFLLVSSPSPVLLCTRRPTYG